jgi:hypothetical protein
VNKINQISAELQAEDFFYLSVNPVCIWFLFACFFCFFRFFLLVFFFLYTKLVGTYFYLANLQAFIILHHNIYGLKNKHNTYINSIP